MQDSLPFYFFNPNLFSKATEVRQLANQLFDTVVIECYERRTGVIRDRAIENLTILIANLHRVAEAEPGTTEILYSRNRSHYVDQHASFETLTEKLLPALKFAQLIDWDNTKQEEWAKDPDETKQSSMWPTEKLLAKFEVIGLATSMFREREPKSLVICRSKPKQIKRKTKKDSIVSLTKAKGAVRNVRLPGSPKARERERESIETVRRLHKLLAKHFVGYFIPDTELRKLNILRSQLRKIDGQVKYIDELNLHMRRIFNWVSPSDTDLDKGGRFYGGFWQTIPSEDRHSKVWINDAFGVEVDFSSNEARLAYALKGIPVTDDDPYWIGGLTKTYRDTARDCAKLAMLISINGGHTHSKTAAESLRTQLLIKYFKQQKQLGIDFDVSSADEIPDQALLWPTSMPIDDFVAMVWDRHAKLLPSSKEDGLRRMFIESQITADVINSFTKHGKVILPVHDSFVVHPADFRYLITSMGFAFVERTGGQPFFSDESPMEDALAPENYPNEPPVDRVYPWQVDRSEYSTFFSMWKSTGQNIDAVLDKAEYMIEWQQADG